MTAFSFTCPGCNQPLSGPHLECGGEGSGGCVESFYAFSVKRREAPEWEYEAERPSLAMVNAIITVHEAAAKAQPGWYADQVNAWKAGDSAMSRHFYASKPTMRSNSTVEEWQAWLSWNDRDGEYENLEWVNIREILSEFIHDYNTPKESPMPDEVLINLWTTQTDADVSSLSAFGDGCDFWGDESAPHEQAASGGHVLVRLTAAIRSVDEVTDYRVNPKGCAPAPKAKESPMPKPEPTNKTVLVEQIREWAGKLDEHSALEMSQRLDDELRGIISGMHDVANDIEVDALVTDAEARSEDCADGCLDELVIGVLMGEASDINNGGTRKQVAYLLAHGWDIGSIYDQANIRGEQ
jgi:hypothetical protein